MYLSTHHVRIEMQVKEAEFVRELRRARQSESRTIYLLSNLFGKMSDAVARGANGLFVSSRTPTLSSS